MAAENPLPQPRVIRAEDIPPTIRQDSADIREGRAVHRRVVSKAKDKSKDLDVGYNSYVTGVGGNAPYAYTKDELCYIPVGELEADSDGVTVIAKAGDFMWRPAGAPTQSIWVKKDAVSICAFGPARDEGWGHRLPPEKIGVWAGAEADRPHVHLYDWRYITPTVGAGDGVVVREVVSAAKDGAVYIAATHETYKAGVETRRPAKASDEVCWLESGQMTARSGGGTLIFKAGEFLFLPAGASLDSYKAAGDSVAICFFRPVAPS